MDRTVKPDYQNMGIVNLMQSVATACGGRTAAYPPLAALSPQRLAESRHVVLLVIDGLGQSTLDRLAAGQTLRRHRIATLSSVFPSTTASAITTFMTGRAPAQHALTGWHMHLDEIGQTLAILPLTPRFEPASQPPEALPPLLFDTPSLFGEIGRESWVVAPARIAGSPFNAWHARGAATVAYDDLPGMFAQIAGLLAEASKPRYIYAYYPDLDTVSHRFGTQSEQAQQTLDRFDRAFGEFADAVQGRDAWVLATADHGFIDSPPERVVDLGDHPSLAALLVRPLCGERRAAYAYVRPEDRPAFEAYVDRHLASCLELRSSAELVREGWFGPPPFHARLASRVGDYTLMMKEDWTITDWQPGERRFALVGVHGGTSRDEMLVPLIALRV